MRKIILIITAMLLTMNCFSQAPSWAWATSAGGANGSELGSSVTTDVAGNIYVTGYFTSSTIEFGTITLTHTGSASHNMYLVKYDSTGVVLWATNAGGGGNSYGGVNGSSVVTDATGNVYVAGTFNGYGFYVDTTFLMNNDNTGITGDFFLIKYNSSGTNIWAKSFGGSDEDDGVSSLAVDALGDVYLTGTFRSSSLVLGSDTLTNPGTADMFLAKYDTSGNVLWAKSAEGGYNSGRSVAIGADGDVYVLGNFGNSSLILGTTTLTNPNVGSYDLFLVKYNSAGAVLWVISAGGSDSDLGVSITTDIAGNVYATGEFRSTAISFGTVTLINSSVGNFDIFLVKYDSIGTLLWAKKEGGSNYDGGYSVVDDETGNLYLTGYFLSSTIVFGTTTLTNAGTRDVFLVKYDTSGNVLWAKSAGGNSDDYGYSVAADGTGNVYVTGYFVSPTITFGSTLINAGDLDMYIAKIGLSTTVGIEKEKTNNEITISPNPFTSQTTITFNDASTGSTGSPTAATHTIKITDVLGKEIKTINFTGTQCVIEKGEMERGIYFVQVNSGSAGSTGSLTTGSPTNVVNRKIVVQ